MRCQQCGGSDTTTIVIKLHEDDSLSFYQCRRCESKWWEHDGGPIALDEVLNLTTEAEARR